MHWRLVPVFLSSIGLAGCKACLVSCIDPSLPVPSPGDSSKEDSGDSSDSAEDSTESSPPIDTSPEPPCDVPEVEPNGLSSAQDLPLEQWSCGVFAAYLDVDGFTFDVPDAGWVRLNVRATAIGSAADVSVNFGEPDGDYGAIVGGSYSSSDPLLVFYTDKARTFEAYLSEAYYGYGDNYTWEMLASTVKPPVTWTVDEIEPNDDKTEAMAMASGDVMYGTISEGSDFDWIKISIPDDAKHNVSVKVIASREGAPTDLRALAYDPSGVFAKSASSGENTYDRDPWMEFTTDEAGDWTVLLREEFAKGSPIYWYTVAVTVTDAPEEDTAAGDTASAFTGSGSSGRR